jgi:hypothetical protein
MGTGSRKTTILLLLSLIRRCGMVALHLYQVDLLSTFFLLVRCYHTVIHQNEISESSTVRHLPAWFPGAGFKRTAARWAQTLTEMVEDPHQYVKQQMVSRIMDPFASLNTDSSLSAGVRNRGTIIYFPSA